MKHVITHGLTQQTANQLCLVLFSLKGIDSHTGVELYNRERVRLHNRTKDAYSEHSLDALGLEEGIRLSACHYNSPEDIDRFLQVTALIGEMSQVELDEFGLTSGASGPGEG
jgi:selenocysteine lyase/cysteine desulfurase